MIRGWEGGFSHQNMTIHLEIQVWNRNNADNITSVVLGSMVMIGFSGHSNSQLTGKSLKSMNVKIDTIVKWNWFPM
jgi:hypothetical protein